MSASDALRVRRLGGWSLVIGLSLAALVAIVALLSGDFDDTEVRVILTSIGFAAFGSLAAGGATARMSRNEWAQSLGGITVILAGTAFVLLCAVTWPDDWGEEGLVRAFGCVAVAAVGSCHGALVLRSRRSSDGAAVVLLVAASLVLAGADAAGAILAISGAVDVEDGGGRAFAVGLVLLVLTTALAPILRRMQRSEGPAAGAGDAATRLADEVLASADRLDELVAGPGNRAPEIRAETERLRRLARSFQA